MREILEIPVSVEAILIYAILNKTIMFSRISSRSVRISLYKILFRVAEFISDIRLFLQDLEIFLV